MGRALFWRPELERWLLSAEGAVGEAAAPTVGLAMDLDPRRPSVTLGVRILSGGGPELEAGVIYRRFFPGARARWAPALGWLDGAPAGALLARVLRGYEAEPLWSGDWIARWTPEGLSAARALHAELARRLAQPQ